MIRVSVDLLPFGQEEGRKRLATIDIANDGTGTKNRGNYKARLNPKLEWEEKVVTNYPRESYHVSKLLYLVLKHFYTNQNDQNSK